MKHQDWSKLLQTLEALADRWESLGNTTQDTVTTSRSRGDSESASRQHTLARAYWTNAKELRATLVPYFRSELRVRYYYANEWRTGALLLPPKEDNPCWQVQRDGFGGWVDHVDPDLIRVLF